MSVGHSRSSAFFRLSIPHAVFARCQRVIRDGWNHTDKRSGMDGHDSTDGPHGIVAVLLCDVEYCMRNETHYGGGNSNRANNGSNRNGAGAKKGAKTRKEEYHDPHDKNGL